MKFEKKDFALTLGKRVREVRKFRGFTLERLALDAEIEIKQLTRIEYGQVNTTVFQIYRLSYCLEVNLGELFAPIPLMNFKNDSISQILPKENAENP